MVRGTFTKSIDPLLTLMQSHCLSMLAWQVGSVLLRVIKSYPP